MGKKSVSEETKWQIVGMTKLNISNREIDRRLGVSEKCVRTTLRNYSEFKQVKDLPRSGRPRKLSEKSENYIFRMQRKDPKKSYKNIAREFNESSVNITISKSTVRRVLKRKGLDAFVAARKPLLTARDRLQRLRWCRERLKWSVEEWARVLFSDEANFEVFNRKSKVIVKRMRGEKFLSRHIVPRLQGGGGSVGIWGCFCHKGKGLCSIYQGRVNRFTYISILKNCLKPSVRQYYPRNAKWIFQQDGAPAHTAQDTFEFLSSEKINLLPWCP